MAKGAQDTIHRELYRPPYVMRLFFDFLVENAKIGNQPRLRITIFIESFRLLGILGFFFTLLLGYILTILFVTVDYTAIMVDVFGVTNACIYIDFPPATYVLPFVYLFPMTSLVIYHVIAIKRISKSHGDGKISKWAKKLLTTAHVYCIISHLWFSTVFAIHPDREESLSIYFHSAPYANWKIVGCVLQASVVWFGAKVAWKDISLSTRTRKIFVAISWIHVLLLTIGTILQLAMIIANGLGDVGSKGLVGKGLWWNVHEKPPQLVADLEMIFGHTSPLGDLMLCGLVPLLQIMFLKWKGFTNISKVHAVTFHITDNWKMD